MSFGGGNETQTTTQTQSNLGAGTAATAYSPWIGNTQQYLAGTAANMAAPFLQNLPTSAIAGFNPDQIKGFDLARDMAQGQFQTGGTKAPTAESFKEWMNPYLDTVGKSAVDGLRREYDNNVAKSGARQANGVAFGGSGAALERAQMARGFNQDATDTVLGILSGGYDRANQLAFEGAGMEDQFRNTGLNRQNSALQTLLSTGQMQQDLAQRAIDIPWTMLDRIAAYTPQVYGSVRSDTSTANSSSQAMQPNEAPSAGKQVLGAGLSILGSPTSGGGSLLSSILGF